MAEFDFQLGVKDEVTYGTAVTVDRFFEFNSESVAVAAGRTAGEGLRVGAFTPRSDRFMPYIEGAAGNIQLDVLNKGFGFWLKHMLGTVATTGLGPYTHTGTMGSLLGDAFTCQINRPLSPSGTNQAFTYAGGKVASWTLSNSVEENLLLDLAVDFASVSTATALATASYPAAMEPLSWVGGTVTVGGTQVDVTEVSVEVNNNLAVDRRFIKGSAVKKEPVQAGRREVSFSFSADFESLTQYDRVVSTTRAGALAKIVGTWANGTDQLVVTIPAARFDEIGGVAVESAEALSQSLSGVGLHDGTDSPVTVAYTTADATP